MVAVLVYDTVLGTLAMVMEENLSVSINEWAALWPNEIFFFVEIVEV